MKKVKNLENPITMIVSPMRDPRCVTHSSVLDPFQNCKFSEIPLLGNTHKRLQTMKGNKQPKIEASVLWAILFKTQQIEHVPNHETKLLKAQAFQTHDAVLCYTLGR